MTQTHKLGSDSLEFFLISIDVDKDVISKARMMSGSLSIVKLYDVFSRYYYKITVNFDNHDYQEYVSKSHFMAYGIECVIHKAMKNIKYCYICGLDESIKQRECLNTLETECLMYWITK